jgi:hypothetical protein
MCFLATPNRQGSVANNGSLGVVEFQVKSREAFRNVQQETRSITGINADEDRIVF